MSTASAMLAGDAPANTGQAAPTDPAANPQEPGTQPTSQETPFYQTFSEDHQEYVQRKGFSDMNNVVRSYRELEKMIGHDKITLPKEDDLDGFNQLYSKLGRPDEANAYKYELEPGQTEAPVLSDFRQWAFENGLNQKQFQDIAKKFEAHSSALNEQSVQEFEATAAAETQELQSEWGKAFDLNINKAKQAVKALELDQPTLDALERQIGTKALYQKFAAIGEKIGEDSTGNGAGSTGFALSPDQAKQRIKELQFDKQFFESLQAKNPAAVNEWKQLHEWAANEQN